MHHQHAAAAYQQVAKKTASPRELEAHLLSQAAASLQRIRDDWEAERDNLEPALIFNRKIWTVFLTSVTRPDSPLQQPLRENIANLGLFIMNQTRETLLRPEPQQLDTMISINRELAAGLRTTPQ